MARALPSFGLRDHSMPNDVSPGLLPPQPPPSDGVMAPDPAIDQAEDLAPLVGFFLSLTLTFLCFWRLALFTTAALKYQWQRPKCVKLARERLSHTFIPSYLHTDSDPIPFVHHLQVGMAPRNLLLVAAPLPEPRRRRGRRRGGRRGRGRLRTTRSSSSSQRDDGPAALQPTPTTLPGALRGRRPRALRR